MYDVVYVIDNETLRSIHCYDSIYTLSPMKGTYTNGDYTVTDMYEGDIVWHDGDAVGEATYIVKLSKRGC